MTNSQKVLTRKMTRRIVAPLWVSMCVYLLIRTLLARDSPKQFDDMEEAELLAMVGLSGPTSLLIILPLRWFQYPFSWWPYPENDARTIIIIWLCFFAAGCLQWFVLVPWVVHKGFDAYDGVLSWWRKGKDIAD